MKATKELRAIWKHCLECCGGSYKLVDSCACKSCPLHPFRSNRVMPKKRGRAPKTFVKKEECNSIPGQITMFDAKGA